MEKITAKHPDSQSADLVAQHIEQLSQLFPEVIKEGKVDIEALQDLLGNYIDTPEERFQLNWAGKSQARREAQKRSTGTLRPCPEESVNWDTTENIYIEGDNLEVLKLLQKSYYKKVRMIYIDPPYNTGNDFVYKDNYSDNLTNYLEISGQDRSLGTNTESDGRYHSNWLNMMYPRLKLARNLLADEGVIFISIDDNEIANLKKICDEIFGEENFRNILLVRRYDKNINTQFLEDGLKSFNTGAEYVFIYSKNSSLRMNPVFRKASEERSSQGYWKGFWNDAERKTMQYELLNVEIKKGQWKWKEDVAKDAVKNYEDYLEKFASKMTIEEYWKSTGSKKKFIRRKSEGNGMNKGVEHWIAPSDKILRNTLWQDVFASKILQGFDVPFNNPKNPDLIYLLIEIAFGDLSQGIILDFFSGSGTTFHAVMQLNADDGGNRKSIMVQIPEATPEDSEARKAGYKTIAEIGKERIRRAGKKIVEELKAKQAKEGALFAEEQKKLDIGFKVFKLDSSNINTWDSSPFNLEGALYNSVQNIKSDRTELDLLYEILLKYGIDLVQPINEHVLAGKKVYEMGAGALIVCMADHVKTEAAEAIAQLWKEVKPTAIDESSKAAINCRVVFKDNGFDDNNDKTNVLQILKQHGIDNVVSI
ncbi:Type III restriction-modification system StyLTI enzyme mod [Bacteroidales bacterium CF]|jgi:Adenine specific DNA methylase Mod|nr:Type III restriction-modification system StyLTI enzyme mod [Bacteroidales bacterium CF]